MGIGTTTPNAKFHVLGQVVFEHNNIADAAELILKGNKNLGNGPFVELDFENTDGGITYRAARIASFNDNDTGDGDLRFFTNSNGLSDPTANLATRMVITSDGSVGIGTTSPSELLTLDFAVGGSLDFLGEGAGGSRIQSSGTMVLEAESSALALHDSTGEVFRIVSGAASIGDNTPDALLEISASGGANDLFMLSSDDDTDGDILTVLNSGNVGVGSTSPRYPLVIENDLGVTSTLAALFGGNSSGDAAEIRIGANEASDDNYLVLGHVVNPPAFGSSGDYGYLGIGSNPETLTVNANGNIGIGTTSPNTALSVVGTTSVDKLIVRSVGSRSDPALAIDINNTGIESGFYRNGNHLVAVSAGIDVAGFSSTPNITLRSDGQLAWSHNTLVTGDGGIGLARDSAGVLRVSDGSSGTGALYAGDIRIGTSTTAASLTIQSTSTTDILNLFETGGREVFTILENGNVGVGSSSPSSLLTVTGSTTIVANNTQSYDWTNNNTPDSALVRVGLDTDGNGLIIKGPSGGVTDVMFGVYN